MARLRLGINARYLREYILRGFNRYTLCLLTALQKLRRFDLVLFTDDRSPIDPSFAQLLQAEIVNIESRSVLLWEHVHLPTALRTHEIDIFHAPADGGLPFRKACPYVMTYHRALDVSLRNWILSGELSGRLEDYTGQPAGMRSLYHRVRHDVLRTIYLRAANRIIAVSHYGKRELVELLGVPQEKVLVIYEAADEQFSAAISEEQVRIVKGKYSLPDKYLLFVGGFEPWKNVPGLLRAFVDARRAGLLEGLVLVGSGGDLQGSRSLASALRLSEGQEVLFLERIHQDLPALYRGATAFITLSWGESFGLPLVEAMRCGTPVIASSRGAIPEIVAEGGILVDPRRPRDIVEAILAVTTSPDLRARLGIQAAKRASDFSWDRAAEQTAELYESLVATKRVQRVGR